MDFYLICTSGSVGKSVRRDKSIASSRLTGGTVLCPEQDTLSSCLVLVQPRKTGKQSDQNPIYASYICWQLDLVLIGLTGKRHGMTEYLLTGT